MILKRCIDGEDQLVRFWCPACQTNHVVPVTGKRAWQFNQDFIRPTLDPSVLVTSGHHQEGWNKKDCWCTFKQKNPDSDVPFTCYRCHLFIRNGRIEYCHDCSHGLAGQTIDMVEIPQGKENA